MTTSLVVILVLGLLAGLGLLLAGLCVRKGDHLKCARCSYNIEGLSGGACPECNANLDEPKGIVKGDRSPWLIAFGLAVLLLGAVVWGAAYFNGTSLDQHKPIWVLRAELALVNDEGDQRIADELRRRLFDVKTSRPEQQRIAALALAQARGKFTDHFSSLLTDCALAGVVDADRAEPYMHELLERWSADWLLSKEGRGRSLELGALIQCCGIELESLRPIVRQGLQWAAEDWPENRTPSRQQLVRVYESLLRFWWNSPSSPGRLTTEYLNTLLADAPVVKLTTRPRVEADARFLPYQITRTTPPIAMAPGEMVQIKENIVGVRVVQNGRTLLDRRETQGGMTARYSQHAGHVTSRGVQGSSIRVEDIEPGEVTIEVDIRFSVVMGDEKISGSRGVPDLDPKQSTTVIDRTITLRSTTQVVQPGADEITLRMPGDGDTPDPSKLLEWFAFSPLYYDTSAPSDSSGPWSLSVGRSEGSKFQDRRHDLPIPEIDIAYRVMATQDDTEWEIGRIVNRDVFHLSHGHFQLVSPPLTPMRTNAAGEYEWGIPVPDFERPVRLRLEPAPELAHTSVDMTSIYGVTIDLGSFDIIPVQFWRRAQQSRDELSPAPILSE